MTKKLFDKEWEWGITFIGIIIMDIFYYYLYAEEMMAVSKFLGILIYIILIVITIIVIYHIKDVR